VVTSKIENNYLKIFIDDTLHLAVDTTKLRGIQAWLYTEDFLYIQYYLSDTKIKCEYNSPKIWKEVLTELQNIAI